MAKLNQRRALHAPQASFIICGGHGHRRLGDSPICPLGHLRRPTCRRLRRNLDRPLRRHKRRRPLDEQSRLHHDRDRLRQHLLAPSWSTAAALAATNVITINNRAQGLVGGTWGYNWQWGSLVLGTESDFDGVFGCRNDNNGNFGFFGGNNNDTCGGTAIGLAAVGPPVPGGFSILN